MTVAVYRCITGGYDVPVDDRVVHPEYDYILFTDNPDLSLKGYQTVLIPHELISEYKGGLLNRYYKLLCHRVLSEYEYSIYLDGNVRIHDGLPSLVAKFVASGSDLGLFDHNRYRSLEQELQACVMVGKASAASILKERVFMEQHCVDMTQLISDNSILVRSHEGIGNAMDAWFSHTCDYSGRDQISLSAILHRFPLRVFRFGFAQRKFNTFFSVHPHDRSRSSYKHRLKLFLFGVGRRGLRLLRLGFPKK